MADYHPLIARAVAGLEKSTGEARRQLYERARTALLAQLRGVTPSLDEAEITRERLALEEAIRKVEAEAVRRSREEPRSPPSGPVSRERDPAPRMTAPHAMPPKLDEPPHAEPASPSEDAGSPAQTVADTPPAARVGRGLDPGAPISDQAVKGFRNIVGDMNFPRNRTSGDPPAPDRMSSGRPSERPAAGRNASDRPPPPPPSRETKPPRRPPPPRAADLNGLEPHLFPEDYGPGSGDGAADFDEQQPSSQRPQPPQRQAPERAEMPAKKPTRATSRSYAGAFKIAIPVLAIVLIGLLGWWQRSNIASLFNQIRGPSTQTTQQTTPTKPKISDRIGGGQDSAGGAQVPAVAQRVVLYEENPADPQGKRYVGSVIWRSETVSPGPGLPPELVVRADVAIPERGMTMKWSIRRNTDKALPASHTIEVMFNLPPDFEHGEVANIPGILMKEAEQARGTPLAGLAVKVTNGYFLVGLSAVPTDVQRNLELLKGRPWFDIPIVYTDNRRAILAMEKGTPGDRAFTEAFAAWGE